MLDFYKLLPQIAKLGDQSSTQQDKAASIMQTAQVLFSSLKSREREILVRLKSNEGLPLWPISIPLEPFSSQSKINDLEEEHIVIGVDGSQIMPSQHEMLHCYLLNIGIVQINYGREIEPLLTSTPYFFHQREQLYPLIDRRRLHVDELYVALERNLLELEVMSTQAINALNFGAPVLALMDGSLIPWSLDRMPAAYQAQYVLRMTAILQTFANNRLPLIGYISNSRSTEVINSMRILICPYDSTLCKSHCRDLNEDDFPCSTISPLTDRTLFASLLPEKDRTAVFLSGSNTSKMFPSALQTCFLYCNLGGQIVRLECPRWLFEEKQIFAPALAAIAAQFRRGAGYPVVLAEAHHQAVIKNADREQFFALLSKHYISNGLVSSERSAKAAKKRVSAV